MPRFEWVVSCENNHYLLWQAMLFHYSCLRHQGQAPLVMVHRDEGELLLDGFQRIVERGGKVRSAPNYRRLHGVNYPPRNTAASLKHAETDADYLVLCDCDMIFLQPCPLEQMTLGPGQLTFDKVGYLRPDHPAYQPQLDDACRRAKIPPERLRAIPIDGGVPHVIPRQLQQRLAADWLECLDLFPLINTPDSERSANPPPDLRFVPQRDWLSGMWGLVFATHRLGLEAVMTHWCRSNLEGPGPMPAIGPGGPCLIHYCYGDERFNKRHYATAEAAERTVWNVAPRGDGTVHDELRRQLQEAREFYGIAEFAEGRIADKCG